jgi:predicted NBD/HSP70 family sugar kinase
MIDNDVNLVALEEMSIGASVGVHSMVLFWIGEGIGGALVQGGKLVRGSTGSAGELGGVLISEAPVAPGGSATFGYLEELLSEAGIAKLVAAHEIPGASVIEAVRNATQAAQKHEQFLTILGHRIATGIAGAIGILDPDMVVLAGEIGQAGGRVLAQHVTARLKTLPIAIPQIVPTAVSEHAVRAGAIELALEQTRERVFTGGSAARGLP